MYFPYLRGKQNELLAVRDSDFLLNNRIIPIIEPISCFDKKTNQVSNRVYGQYLRIARKGIRFAIIFNSNNGEPLPTIEEVYQMFQRLDNEEPNTIFPTFEIRPGGRIQDLLNFVNVFRNKQCFIVHRNFTHSLNELKETLALFERPPVHIFLNNHISEDLINNFPDEFAILLNDGFQRCVPNSSYPRDSDFDDLLFTYSKDGFDGFADFSTVGDVYSTGGGAANHIALHVTECMGNSSIKTNHFVSDNPPYRGNDSAKYLNALNTLFHYTQYVNNFDTLGIQQYNESHFQQRYRGLGSPVKWSTMHHMEIIDRKLEEMGVSNFI